MRPPSDSPAGSSSPHGVDNPVPNGAAAAHAATSSGHGGAAQSSGSGANVSSSANGGPSGATQSASSINASLMHSILETGSDNFGLMSRHIGDSSAPADR